MGYHIARAGVNMGYDVTYIHGPVPIKFREVQGAQNISVISTIDMLNTVVERIKENTILIMAAAPADYRPDKTYDYKLKKKENPEIRFIPNPDILVNVYEKIQNEKIPKVILIGFAAEIQNAYEYALSKLERKNLDMIFLNDLSKEGSGFGVDTNELTVIHKDKTFEKWNTDTKEKLGYKIIQEIEDWLNK
jgi:phosphopantothenoylcysteine decarboxylase/phosphopantothenate--cysteine ligase